MSEKALKGIASPVAGIVKKAAGTVGIKSKKLDALAGGGAPDDIPQTGIGQVDRATSLLNSRKEDLKRRARFPGARSGLSILGSQPGGIL